MYLTEDTHVETLDRRLASRLFARHTRTLAVAAALPPLCPLPLDTAAAPSLLVPPDSRPILSLPSLSILLTLPLDTIAILLRKLAHGLAALAALRGGALLPLQRPVSLEPEVACNAQHVSDKAAPILPSRRRALVNLRELPALVGPVAELVRATPCRLVQRLVGSPLQGPTPLETLIARVAQHTPSQRAPLLPSGRPPLLDGVEAPTLLGPVAACSVSVWSLGLMDLDIFCARVGARRRSSSSTTVFSHGRLVVVNCRFRGRGMDMALCHGSSEYVPLDFRDLGAG